MERREMLDRLAAIAVVGNALVAAIAVVWHVRHSPDAAAPVLWLAVGVISTIALALMTTFGSRLANDEQAAGYRMVLLVANIVWVSGLVAVAGGMSQPFYLLYAPSLLLAAVTMGRTSALIFSILSTTGFVIAVGIAGQLDLTHLDSLVIAIPAAPAIVSFVAVVNEASLRAQRDANAQRDSLRQHVDELSHVLARAAEGDLAVRVDHDVVDEALQGLGVAFNNTVGNLRLLVDHIRSGGEQITASAGELLATAEEHAASATQQSSAVAETTSTIEELAATAAQIADTAESVARYAAETLRHAEDGRLAVATSVNAMDAISERVTSISVRALSLGEKSQEIGRILEVIDDLADQTNLLALNAAIEAARAGEHGRGFAVVASEVRKLAERSQESAGQIQAIVAQIQSETNATILASEEGSREVSQGAALAREVVDALERISGMVDETTTAAKEISIATQQQRSASEQVVSAMNQVSDVSRQYAVGSKQAAASAAQLNVLAAELRASIEQFRVA